MRGEETPEPFVWTTDGNNISIIGTSDDPEGMTYSLSGTTLILMMTVVEDGETLALRLVYSKEVD